MKYLWMTLLFVSSEALSQGGVNSFPVGVEGAYGIEGLQEQAKIFEQIKNQNIQKYKFSREFFQPEKLSEVKINTPGSLPREEKEMVIDLFKQIQGLCPNCSTGTTVGGKPIVGLNFPSKSSAPLFGTAGLGGKYGEYISVKKSEYDRLKLKAALYDALQNK